MSKAIKTHCVAPSGKTLCGDPVPEDDWGKIHGVKDFYQAMLDDHQYLCGKCLQVINQGLKPGRSELHRDITSWVKIRMLQLGLTADDISVTIGIHPQTIRRAINSSRANVAAQTNLLAQVVTALGGKLVTRFEIQEVTSES